MSVYLALRQDNKPVLADLVVAAFVGDECRGIAEAQSVKDASYYYLRVRSNEVAGDSVYFRIYDREKNKELATLGSFSFENLRQVGYPSQPWVLTLPVVITPLNQLNSPPSMYRSIGYSRSSHPHLPAHQE